ncbi:MAG TPA: helix-turn-helix transcriptional regulator [Streptosporangiaceae bacterium]|nr:helix-turn-helix transcriptional regulator [Streptosporangiaceae bacterium]
MNHDADVQALRGELGRDLRAARRAAGLSQVQLGRRTGYARSTVSTVESGGQNVPRAFWERCDEALGTGTTLTAGHDRLAASRLAASPPAGSRLTGSRLAGSRASAGHGEAPPGPGRGLGAGSVADALEVYQVLGWQVEHVEGRVELVCGAGVEALEVPRAAGMVAVRWWLHTGGVPDQIRGLPGLPGPRDALAVIAARDRWYFLVQAGACPWACPQTAGPAAAGIAEVVVRWHAEGSRIPAPPSRDRAGHEVDWGHPPPARVRLADPVVLLDLLARAVALTGSQGHTLTLPGGVSVVPAAGIIGRVS